MRRASRRPGERPAYERRTELRMSTALRGGSVSEVEATCQRIADYLIEVSRDQELEPALHAFLRAFDLGCKRLDPEARARSEQVYESVYRHGLAASEGRTPREGCDPYFWG
ncbi:MAG TPA: hypothetical protein VKA86_08675 [Candidatus Krumholzibacteria bacterium]|nr:hypothetical protein [Candidatus Krumholzibacteria bacterium]